MPENNNELSEFTCFEFIRMPDAWVEKPAPAGLGAGWRRAFVPTFETQGQAEIGLYYNGKRLGAQLSQSFRDALVSPPTVLFDVEENQPSNSALNRAAELSQVLGNAGQNQLTMAGSRFEVFRLKELAIAQIGGASALRCSGYFRDPEGLPLNFYEAFNFDGITGEPYCRVYEIYFLASTEELFEQLKPDWQRTWHSLRVHVDSVSSHA